METKLERIADKSAQESRPIFASLYHLLNKELLLQCHKELDGKSIRERINYVVDADIKGFFDHMSHEWTLKLWDIISKTRTS